MNKIENIINRDLNNAYAGYGDFRQSDAILLLKDSFEDLAVYFSTFLAENYEPTNDSRVWESRDVPMKHNIVELFKNWENEI